VFLRRSLIGPFLPPTGSGDDSDGSFRGEITFPKTICIFITSPNGISTYGPFSLIKLTKRLIAFLSDLIAYSTQKIENGNERILPLQLNAENLTK
jgi:hypothetical protein